MTWSVFYVFFLKDLTLRLGRFSRTLSDPRLLVGPRKSAGCTLFTFTFLIHHCHG